MIETGALVKPPQSRHGKGLSMVHRASGRGWGLGDKTVYVKTQTGYNSRPAWRLWRSTPTFACEYEALRVCEDLGLNAPQVLSFRTQDGVTELVVDEIPDALSLPFFWAQASDRRVKQVLNELGSMVGVLHFAGWTHGSIAGGHILVQPSENDRVWLIDYEKARHAWNEKQLQRDLARFFRRAVYLGESDIDYFLTGYGRVRNLREPVLHAMAQRFKSEQRRCRVAEKTVCA